MRGSKTLKEGRIRACTGVEGEDKTLGLFLRHP